MSTDDTIYILAGWDRRYAYEIHKFHNMEWTINIGTLKFLSTNRSAIRLGNDILIIGDHHK